MKDVTISLDIKIDLTLKCIKNLVFEKKKILIVTLQYCKKKKEKYAK